MIRKTQQELLRQAREKLGLTNRELALRLGLKVNARTGESATLLAWLAPEKAAKHRSIPLSALAKLAKLLERK
jgi:transcriptional regulator with XRE-family HTH domain